MSNQIPGSSSMAYWDSRKRDSEGYGWTSKIECWDGIDCRRQPLMKRALAQLRRGYPAIRERTKPEGCFEDCFSIRGYSPFGRHLGVRRFSANTRLGRDSAALQSQIRLDVG